MLSFFLSSLLAFTIGCSQKDATVTQAPSTPTQVSQPSQETGSTLIKPGAAMPDVTLTALDGKPLKLSDQLKGHKALLLNFWFYT